MKIEILGMGCPKCNQVEKTARQIVAEMALDAQVVKVTDMKKIASYGAVMTPGVVIDGKLVHADGTVPDKARLTTLIVNSLASK